ncbi:PEP-CTERM sorting domain-containing protein [Armatimonas sp.]
MVVLFVRLCLPRPASSSAPEPGTLALLALGMVGGIVARRRK